MTPDEPGWPEDRDGFRLRGMEMTRTETFTDAAFAFSVSLLVIASQSVPTTFDELRRAMAGVPAFGVSFLFIMLFWYGHWKWSRRYGLEDLQSIFLSCVLVFATLVYVYPLKFVYLLLTNYLAGATSGSGIRTMSELYQLFAIYGAGYAAMNLVLAGLNGWAYRKRTELGLNEIETYLTVSQIWNWLIPAAVGTVSVTLALTMPPVRFFFPIPAMLYMLLGVLMPWHSRRSRRRLQALRLR